MRPASSSPADGSVAGSLAKSFPPYLACLASITCHAHVDLRSKAVLRLMLFVDETSVAGPVLEVSWGRATGCQAATPFAGKIRS